MRGWGAAATTASVATTHAQLRVPVCGRRCAGARRRPHRHPARPPRRRLARRRGGGAAAGGGSSGDGSAAAAATVGTAARRSLATAAWPCRWRFLPPSAAAARSRFVAASVSTTARLLLGTAAAPAGRPGCGSRMRGRSGGMRGGAAGDTADADRCRPEVKAVAKYFRSALLPLLMRDSGVAAVGADDDDVGALSSRHADGTPAAVAYRDPRAVAGGGGWAPCVCGVVGDSRR